MKHSVPDDSYVDEEYDDYVYIDDDEDDTPRSGTAKVLGIVAAVAIVIAVLVLAVMPMLRSADGDPAAIVQEQHRREEEALKASSETEETTAPTIPPELSEFNQYDFQYDKRNLMKNIRKTSYTGVDVSEFQHEVDWPKVKAAGIDFAIIRLGFRGYGQAGKMVEDKYAQRNLKETAAIGMPVGAYFFSQATTLDEAREEIDYMLEILGDHPLQYPLILDWEVPEVGNGDTPRTKNVTRETLTEIQSYYCAEISQRGYTPMVYFNSTQAAEMLHLNQLEDYPFWLALYQDRMTFRYQVEMWQYTCTGHIPGIDTEVDLNVYFGPDVNM